MNILKFHTREAMVVALAEKNLKALKQAIKKKGQASWAVSGGSTPLPLFQLICQAELAWSNVTIALVDERWVPESHARSNTAFVKRNLLQSKASAAKFIPMVKKAESTQCSADFANKQYGEIALPFDCLLLGMGGDGHTASLFPGAEGLEAAMAPDIEASCISLKAQKSDVTGDELDRVSLTAAEICRADTIDLMITGEAKMNVLIEAMAEDSVHPIGRLIRLAPEKFEIYWAP